MTRDVVLRISAMIVLYLGGYIVLLMADWRIAVGVLFVNIAILTELSIREDYLR